MTAIPTLDEVKARLTAPGAPFEMEEREVRGVRLRTWKNAPPNLRVVYDATNVHGPLPFIVYEDERLSYADLHARVRALAHVLWHQYGVRKGDRVAIAMRNFPEWPIAFWATVVIGAVSVPLNAWWTGPELEYGLSDSGTKVLFVDHERAVRLAEHLPNLNLAATIVVRDGGAVGHGLKRFADVLDAAPPNAAIPDVEIDPDDDATIFYTSGTTGRPKGALGTHRNMVTNLVSLGYCTSRAELRKGNVPPSLSGEPLEKTGALLSVPFFHATGCHSVLVANSAAGNKLVIMHKWDPERAIELIEREKLRSFGGVPAMVWQVLESPAFAKHDLSTVKSIGYGGAPAAPELVARIRQAFPDVTSSNGYGLTETSSVTTMNAGPDYQRKPDSVGQPVPICDVKTVDAMGNPVAPGEIGELWIKGPNVIKAYWNKPEATAQTITDGWLHSGDLARIDDEGFVYIVDRAKDMVIRGGENVYSVEVEDALYSHPAVMDAAVIGLPHRVLGEEVGAVVQVKPGTEVSEAELQAHCRARIAAFKVPVRIDIRTEPLPRNANGKILKRELKKELGVA
jgi:long-chain acyl-CoA synthetase